MYWQVMSHEFHHGVEYAVEILVGGVAMFHGQVPAFDLGPDG